MGHHYYHLHVIDTHNNTKIGKDIPVGVCPEAILYVDAYGRIPTPRIYVADVMSDAVSVIDGNTNTIIKNITVGRSPVAIGRPVAIGPLNFDLTPRIYVANLGGHTVTVIDGNTNTIIKNITVGRSPVAIDFDPLNFDLTPRIYVANLGGHTVTVIGGITNTIIKNITVGGYPRAIGVDMQRDRIYVPLQLWMLTEMDIEYMLPIVMIILSL